MMLEKPTKYPICTDTVPTMSRKFLRTFEAKIAAQKIDEMFSVGSHVML